MSFLKSLSLGVKIGLIVLVSLFYGCSTTKVECPKAQIYYDNWKEAEDDLVKCQEIAEDLYTKICKE